VQGRVHDCCCWPALCMVLLVSRHMAWFSSVSCETDRCCLFLQTNALQPPSIKVRLRCMEATIALPLARFRQQSMFTRIVLTQQAACNSCSCGFTLCTAGCSSAMVAVAMKLCWFCFVRACIFP
jgi:hypothetical protein